MTADLTWLLLAPNRAIRNRQDKHMPAEWVGVPTHAVLVGTPDGKLLWDTSCPHDWETRWAPTRLLPVRAGVRRRVPGLVNNLEQFYWSVEQIRDIATEANATVVSGHDPDQIAQLRTVPEGSNR
jgi:hypothetical protein